MSKRKIVVATFAILALSGTTNAFAAPGDSGQGMGGCVDNYFGNATNPREGGHGVIPSQSPGPWLNNEDDPDNPSFGTTLGEANKIARDFGFRNVQEAWGEFPVLCAA